jgi:hypothetical protein
MVATLLTKLGLQVRSPRFDETNAGNLAAPGSVTTELSGFTSSDMAGSAWPSLRNPPSATMARRFAATSEEI